MPGKPASILVQSLLFPPFGIRRRSIPVILAAALRKYVLRGNITIKEKELPFNKIDSEVIEAVVANPEKFTVIYAEVGERQKAIVDGMCILFGIDLYGDLGEKTVLLRDKVIAWWQGLPIYARKTTDISNDAKVMKEKVFTPLPQEGTEVRILISLLTQIMSRWTQMPFLCSGRRPI